MYVYLTASDILSCIPCAFMWVWSSVSPIPACCPFLQNGFRPHLPGAWLDNIFSGLTNARQWWNPSVKLDVTSHFHCLSLFISMHIL